MAVYRNIQTTFWTDSTIVDDFTPEDKYFYLYLFTNPHTNLCGCYEISKKQASLETGYSADTIDRLLDRFERTHKVICFSKLTKEVLLVNWSNYNWTSSDKFRKPLFVEIQHIKNEKFKEFLMAKYDNADTVSIPYTYGMDTTVTDTVNNNIYNNTVNTKENEVNITNNKYSISFEDIYSAYPRKGDKQKAYKCYQARLKEGYSEEELMTATKNYAAYCEKEKREQKYIKLASTFFGVNTPFVDYLKGDDHSGNESNTTSDSGTSKVEYTEEQRQAARDYLSGVQRGGLFD